MGLPFPKMFSVDSSDRPWLLPFIFLVSPIERILGLPLVVFLSSFFSLFPHNCCISKVGTTRKSYIVPVLTYDPGARLPFCPPPLSVPLFLHARRPLARFLFVPLLYTPLPPSLIHLWRVPQPPILRTTQPKRKRFKLSPSFGPPLSDFGGKSTAFPPLCWIPPTVILWFSPPLDQ